MADVLTVAEPLARVAIQAAAASLIPGAVLSVAVALGLRQARPSAAVRHSVWFAALLLLACMPAAAAVLARSPRTGPVAESAVGLRPVPRAGREAAGRIDLTSRQPGSTRAAAAFRARPTVNVPGGRWVVLPFAAILGGVALGLARLLVSLAAVRRLIATSRALPNEAERMVRELVGREAPWTGVRLRLTDRLRTPATAGLARPAILLPPRVLHELAPDELRAVLLHELAHVRRGDPWWNLAQRLAAACLWWHPAALWVSRRLELEREMACDEAVVGALGRPLAYARSLTRLAELARAARVPVLATAATRRSGHLARRVEALVAHARHPRGTPSSIHRPATLAVTAAAGALLVAFSPSVALVGRAAVHAGTLAISTSAEAVVVRTVASRAAAGHVVSSPPSAEKSKHAFVHRGSEAEGTVGERAVHAGLPDLRPDAALARADVPAALERLRPMEAGERIAVRDDSRGRGELEPPVSRGRRASPGRSSFVAAFTAADGPGAQSGRALADLPGVAASGALRFAPAGLVLSVPRPRLSGLGGW